MDARSSWTRAVAGSPGKARPTSSQIMKALLNLGPKCARYALPHGGTPEHSRTCQRGLRTRRSPTQKPGEFVALTVSDTGLGACPRKPAARFARFSTKDASRVPAWGFD